MESKSRSGAIGRVASQAEGKTGSIIDDTEPLDDNTFGLEHWLARR